MSEEQLNALLLALSSEGFSLPFMARTRDHETPQELAAADAEAWQDNQAALRRALHKADK